jgi:GT2 family glycosyltransferase
MVPVTHPPSVAAVILNWNQAEMTRECVASVLPQVDHIYVVDNGSHASDRELLHGLDDEKTTVLVNATNLGYAGGCNRGVFAAVDAGFDAVLIMNNDAFPDPGSIAPLLARLEADPGLAAVGPVVVQRGTREVLHAACALEIRTGRARWLQRGTPLAELGHRPIPTAYLSGEVILVRSGVVRSLGMFDERYFCYYEDVEWGLRARRAGLRLEVVPDGVFEHVVGGTSAGLVGMYYRARNLPLFLRIALGRTRLASLAISAPVELLFVISLARRRRFSLIVLGVLRGWMAGVALRS